MHQEILLYHSMLIKIFLALLVINALVPFLSRATIATQMRNTRISFFVYFGFLTMVAFTGLVAIMVLEYPWGHAMTLMVFSFGLLIALEVMRAKKLHKRWMISESAANISLMYVAGQIVIVAAMTVLMIMEKKGAISLS